jgi:hypothetical protein
VIQIQNKVQLSLLVQRMLLQQDVGQRTHSTDDGINIGGVLSFASVHSTDDVPLLQALVDVLNG